MRVLPFQVGFHNAALDRRNPLHFSLPAAQLDSPAPLHPRYQTIPYDPHVMSLSGPIGEPKTKPLNALDSSVRFQVGSQPLGPHVPQVCLSDPIAKFGTKLMNMVDVVQPLPGTWRPGASAGPVRPVQMHSAKWAGTSHGPGVMPPTLPQTAAQVQMPEALKQQAPSHPVVQTQPAPKMAMLSEEMETQMGQLNDKSAPHIALGRSPEEVSRHIQVISLGSSCGVKMTIRRLGLDEATLPFDWTRTSSKGITKWLQDDFTDFLQGPFRRVELTFRDVNMTVYRSLTHSFWHDDLETLDTQQKLSRRVQRFLALDKDVDKFPARSLLCVRCCVTSLEVLDSENMYKLLQQRFEKSGRKVWLLVIMDEQDRNGPILHSTLERLIFWVKPLCTGRLQVNGDGPGPYEEAIAFACRRMLQDPEGLMPGGKAGLGTWPEVTSSAEMLRPGGPLCLRQSEAGLWCGMVLRKGAPEETMFAAFEGYSEREIPYLNLAQSVSA